MITREDVITRLELVNDPEFHVDVWNLGLIYDINIEEKIDIKMTLTTPTCPAAGQIIAEIKSKVREMPNGRDVSVNLVFDPPWTVSMMTKKGRKMLPSQTIDFMDFDLD